MWVCDNRPCCFHDPQKTSCVNSKALLELVKNIKVDTTFSSRSMGQLWFGKGFYGNVCRPDSPWLWDVMDLNGQKEHRFSIEMSCSPDRPGLARVLASSAFPLSPVVSLASLSGTSLAASRPRRVFDAPFFHSNPGVSSKRRGAKSARRAAVASSLNSISASAMRPLNGPASRIFFAVLSLEVFPEIKVGG